MKAIELVILSIIICLVLLSCSQKEDDARYTGILANESVVSSLRQDIADREDSLLANKDDVFWTESGKIWHLSHDCSYLANSKVILHGTVEEAKFEGKEKACDKCSSGNLDSFYDSLENNEYKHGDVFFTREGKVWHTDLNCSVIVGAQKIYFADEATAKLLGKFEACEECER